MGVLTASPALARPAAVPSHLRASASGRGASPVVAMAIQRPRISAVSAAVRRREDLTAFPGEDAPGTGRRVLPPRVDPTALEASATSTSHRCLTTEELYNAFPTLVRSSVPSFFEVSPEVTEPPRGPRVGKRVPPGRTDAERATVPHPSEHSDPEALRRTLAMRRSMSWSSSQL